MIARQVACDGAQQEAWTTMISIQSRGTCLSLNTPWKSRVGEVCALKTIMICKVQNTFSIGSRKAVIRDEPTIHQSVHRDPVGAWTNISEQLCVSHQDLHTSCYKIHTSLRAARRCGNQQGETEGFWYLVHVKYAKEIEDFTYLNFLFLGIVSIRQTSKMFPNTYLVKGCMYNYI